MTTPPGCAAAEREADDREPHLDGEILNLQIFWRAPAQRAPKTGSPAVDEHETTVDAPNRSQAVNEVSLLVRTNAWPMLQCAISVKLSSSSSSPAARETTAARGAAARDVSIPSHGATPRIAQALNLSAVDATQPRCEVVAGRNRNCDRRYERLLNIGYGALEQTVDNSEYRPCLAQRHRRSPRWDTGTDRRPRLSSHVERRVPPPQSRR